MDGRWEPYSIQKDTDGKVVRIEEVAGMGDITVWDACRIPLYVALMRVTDAEGRLLSVNLDLKNPKGKADFEHLPPAQLVEDIIAKEKKILEILAEIKAELGATV